ncbi:hypothetical protein PV797_07360 [Clostridiaceae bacterium M8S5]|nr:hypothetical protein PV797_07360 [Clostridiaceae bacterium M8S5]
MAEDLCGIVRSYYFKVFEQNYCGKLFHYTRKETVAKILNSNTLLISRLDTMDDKDEWRYGLNILRKELNEGKYSEETKKKLNQEISKSEEEVSKTYVFSCSKSNKNNYLWKEYAKDSGYVFEFLAGTLHDKFDELMGNESEPNFTQYKCLVERGKVIYDKDKQLEIIRTLLTYVDNHISMVSNKLEEIDTSFMIGKIIDICALFKKDEKNYQKEDEYRFIFYKSSKEDIGEKLKMDFSKRFYNKIIDKKGHEYQETFCVSE